MQVVLDVLAVVLVIAGVAVATFAPLGVFFGYLMVTIVFLALMLAKILLTK